MKVFKAFVRIKETGNHKVIESAYESKTAFIRDLRGNGFAVDPVMVQPKALFHQVWKGAVDQTPGDWKYWLKRNRKRSGR